MKQHSEPPVTTAPSPRSRALAHLLDTYFRIPGTRIRFGIDPLLGLVPGLGDVAGGVLSSYIVLAAAHAGASRAVLVRMLANLGIDTIFSVIPLVGDLFDAGWKANRRNLALLEAHLENPDRARAASRGFIVMLCFALLLLILALAVFAVVAVRWLIGLFT